MAKRNTLIPLKDRIKGLESSYLRMEDFIRNRLFGFTVYTDEKARKLKAEIFKKIEEREQYNQLWAINNLTVAFDESSGIAKRHAEIITGTEKEPGVNLFKKARRREIGRFIDQTLGYFTWANKSYRFAVRSFFKNMKNAQRKTDVLVQNFVDHWGPDINEEVEDIKKWAVTPAVRTTKAGYDYLATPTRREVQKQVKKAFEKEFGDFDFIQVVMKNGKIRNYNPTKYFHMVARTELARIQTQATINRAKQYKIKYVQVTDHANPCPICVPFAGQIYTIEGEDLNYPPLVAPPYHPHCQHSVFPITPDVIAANAKDPRVPNPPKPAWGLTVDKQLKILTEQRRAA